MKNTLLALLLPLSIIAQNEDNNWVFGQYAGLDFSTDPPTTFQTSIDQEEGCSSMSDADGNLLFYTDGMSIWNKNHAVVPHGAYSPNTNSTFALSGWFSSAQSVQILKKPGADSLYYMLTAYSYQPFEISLFDLRLDGGLGDIDTTFWNVVLTDSVTEKNVAIRNGLDYWVITHDMGNNDFYAYYIDENGINTTPVVSSIGIAPGTGGGPMVHADAIGILKPSPSTYKLASTTTHMHTVELFDFDPCTGVLSNVITLSDITNQFIDYPIGVEFSENEQYLYVASSSGNIHQFDISSGNQASIIASHTIIGFCTSPS